MDIGTLAANLPEYRNRLAHARAAIGGDIAWYPYDILGNLHHLDLLLNGANRDLDALAQGLPVADIGGADGDLAFVLERACGWSMEVIDTPATNMNGLRAVRALRSQLGSGVQIRDIDLDSEFHLPTERYGLVIMLGILYHLQNPYYVLHELSNRAGHLLLSTRVARFAGLERTPIGGLPVAYLVNPTETNNDATNYWMFSPAGLERLVQRAGWSILENTSFGDVEASDPASPDHDERSFMLLRSNRPATPAHTQQTATNGRETRARPDRLAELRTASRRVAGRTQQFLSSRTRGGAAAPSPADSRGADTSTAPSPVDPAQSASPEPVLLAWPLDHFYSPVANSRALAREPARSRVWPTVPHETVGLDWRAAEQEALLRDDFATQAEIVFPHEPTGDQRDYHASNEMFSPLDAWMLQAVLRHFRPRRMIEVGCGYSSLVTARVNREYLEGALDFTCIEPYPPDFLQPGVEGISRLISRPVEEVPIETFSALGSGDVLFIDSSHTVKTGGDVTFLVEEVLPRLADGVVVHFHDMFLPFDYPTDWVFSGRAWNEQYLVRAFLAFNSAFGVLLSVGWLSHYRKDLLASVLPDYPELYGSGGGSLWIRRS